MKRNYSLVVCCGALIALLCLSPSADAATVTFGGGANQFDMEFVAIGSPGNAADTTGLPTPAGSVAYNYSIGKHEVSRDMVIKANAAGNLGITLFDMTSFGGNGVDRPATGFSWNEAARFVNWLNTFNGFMEAYKFTTQPGDVGYSSNADISLWQPGDAGYDASNPYRNSLAKYVLPTADEWYKAAYYDPTANGGTGGYWNYATGSDAAPTAVASGTAAGTAVYLQSDSQGPADITLAGGLSPFGTMGQGGNVWEWEETSADMNNSLVSSFRGFRGGLWVSSSNFLQSSTRSQFFPAVGGNVIGFRVASLSAAVPEPNSLVLTTCVAVCGLLTRGSRRK